MIKKTLINNTVKEVGKSENDDEIRELLRKRYANRILDRLFAIGPNEEDLLVFKVNNDLNLKYVEYNQELADINERVKDYLNRNFNYSL